MSKINTLSIPSTLKELKFDNAEVYLCKQKVTDEKCLIITCNEESFIIDSKGLCTLGKKDYVEEYYIIIEEVTSRLNIIIE